MRDEKWMNVAYQLEVEMKIEVTYKRKCNSFESIVNEPDILT